VKKMKKFGHYEVTAELGRGGMGVVYKGWEPSLNRKVAIKCLGEHLLNDADLVERFTREAKATAALNDPNVIQIYYIGKEQGQPFFAMEYIEGQSLDDILNGGNALSVNHAKNILKQACKGLSAAHKIDLVHRDIKPANIMITTNGTLKIVDFGIARTREYGDKLTNTGEFVGTPGYLSPEVCIGKEVDARSDIFSLGIVFYEMLAGKVPFENDSPLGLMLEVVQSEIPDIRALNKKVDKKTSYILNKMIAKSPDERYQSCEEIMRDLGNVLDNQPISVLKKDAVVVNHPAQARSNISEQVTLPSGAAITQKNAQLPSKPKSNKMWLVAATLFAIVGAASVGYYKGYLPFSPKSDNYQSAALLDNNLVVDQPDNQSVVSNSSENQSLSSVDNNVQESSQNEASENTSDNDVMAGISDMFSDDTQQDVVQVDNSGSIDFPKSQNDNSKNLEGTVEQSEAGFQIDVVQNSKDQLHKLGQKHASTTMEAEQQIDEKLSSVDTSHLVAVAHNSSNQVNDLIESKTKVPPVQIDTIEKASKQVQKTITQPRVIPLNKGVVVVAFGDPAVANPIEKIIESQLKQQGIKVMNENFISGMKQLLDQGMDLAEMKNLIERNGGQAMVIANVNYVGSQELLYAGRSTELVNAQVDIDTYDIKSGDSIGSGFGSKINYTSLNATDQASDVVMEYTDELVNSLKDKI